MEQVCEECGGKFTDPKDKVHGVDGNARHRECHKKAHAERVGEPGTSHGGPTYVARRSES